VVLFIIPNPTRNLATLKELNHFRATVYRIDMGEFRLDTDPNKVNPAFFKTYEDLVKNDPVIRLLDMPTKNMATTTKCQNYKTFFFPVSLVIGAY
jgi:hypothetical protein